jgi:hypothetical protein
VDEPAPYCEAKSADAMLRQIRYASGCTNWEDEIVDATCECTGHGMMEIPCAESDVTLWESGGETCIVVTPDGDADWTKHAWYYPTTYGTECGLTPEPGSFACTSTDEGHAWENPSSMYDATYGGEDWCAKEWCWVDVCSCNNQDMAKSSWGAGYYSYSTCGADDTYTETATCVDLDMDACKDKFSECNKCYFYSVFMIIVCLCTSDYINVSFIVCLCTSDVINVTFMVCLSTSESINVTFMVYLCTSNVMNVTFIVCLCTSD